ncbi:hypothetical protein [Sinomicrobium sp.]
MKNILVALLTAVVLWGCDNNDAAPLDDNELLSGAGSFSYTGYAPLSDAPVRVYYYIPEGDVANMPVLFVMHGSSRNGDEYRDAWTATAKSEKVIIVAPEFSEEFYPGGSGYNMGNMFSNGNNPSPSGLNASSKWAFSIIEPLFDEIKLRTGSHAETYDMFAHSAGAQFGHRFIMSVPEARVRKLIASSAGWYSVPDESIAFPYGIGGSPITRVAPEDYFSKEMIIQIGENDVDPDSAGLRHNDIVDEQGLNRYERGQYFFHTSEQIAADKGSPFAWTLDVVPGAAHDFRPAIPSAVRILYGDQ